MKQKIAFILILVIALSSLSFSQVKENHYDFLEEKTIDEWGILALAIGGKKVEDLKVPPCGDSTITTDVEAYIIGELAKGNKDLLKVEQLYASQLSTGKFPDYLNGTGEELMNAHIWGILALYAGNEGLKYPKKAKQWLLEQQLEDGSFPLFVGSRTGSLDLTGMALMALNTLGCTKDQEAIKKGFRYLEKNIRALESSEALSWLILAKVVFQDDSRAPWVKALNAYQRENGYAHVALQSSGNYMATWHSVLALTDHEHNYSFLTHLRNQQRYSDLALSTDYLESIYYLLEKEYLKGYPSGRFKPLQTMTRGEVAKVLVEVFDLDFVVADSSDFKDIERYWGKDYIQRAHKSGLIQGMTPELFMPDKRITGAELAVILVRQKGLVDQVSNKNNLQWYDGYLQTAQENDLLYEDFEATKAVTRGQVARGMYKYLTH